FQPGVRVGLEVLALGLLVRQAGALQAAQDRPGRDGDAVLPADDLADPLGGPEGRLVAERGGRFEDDVPPVRWRRMCQLGRAAALAAWTGVRQRWTVARFTWYAWATGVTGIPACAAWTARTLSSYVEYLASRMPPLSRSRRRLARKCCRFIVPGHTCRRTPP